MAFMACASSRQFHHSIPFSLNPSPSSYSYRSSAPRLSIPTNIRSPSRILANSAVQSSDSATKEDTGLKIDLFSCPICFDPLLRKGPPGLNLQAIYRSAFKCQNCNKSYSSKDFYLDLTVTSGTEVYTEFKPARTELFRNPLVSFLYERGWRQNFNRSGFPGPDDEFKIAQEYFKPAEGGLLVDVSCGSGLFSRKFAKAGTYSGVIALDFSENMLRQCYDFIRKDNTMQSCAC